MTADRVRYPRGLTGSAKTEAISGNLAAKGGAITHGTLGDTMEKGLQNLHLG